LQNRDIVYSAVLWSYKCPDRETRVWAEVVQRDLQSSKSRVMFDLQRSVMHLCALRRPDQSLPSLLKRLVVYSLPAAAKFASICTEL